MLPKPIPITTTKKSTASASASASDDARLLHDIESLSKALSLDSNPSPIKPTTTTNRSISAPKSHPKKEAKKKPKPNSNSNSFWSWKPLRALSSQFRGAHRRFDCLFSLHVHAVDNLPPLFSASTVSVHWRRTTDPQNSTPVSTRPARVFNSSAQFDDTLTYRCSVHVSPTGPSGSAKYEARHFLIVVRDVDAPVIDLGRNLIDLTRLLPLTLEELESEDEEGSSGKWSTSFRLTGKAKGGVLNVSFGYCLVRDGVRVGAGEEKEGRGLMRSRDRSRSVEDVKVLHEVLPCSKSEASILDGVGGVLGSSEGEDLKPWKVAEENMGGGDGEKECEEPEFSVIEQGVEIADKDRISEPKLENVEFGAGEGVEIGIKDLICEPTLERVEIEAGEGVEMGTKDPVSEPKLEKVEFGSEEGVVTATKDQIREPDDSEKIDKESVVAQGQEEVSEKPNSQLEFLLGGHVFEDPVMEDLDSAFSNLSILEWENLKSPDTKPMTPHQMSYAKIKSNYRGMKSKSLRFDDETVASEFLSMLGIEHSPFGLSSDSDPESPRERLWKQFEKESLSTNNSIFRIDVGEGKEPNRMDGDFAEDFDLSSIVNEAETELQKATQAMDSKSRAKMLEDAETEALMRQWGFNEKAFHNSPPGSRSGFGSPIDFPPEEPLELPPLGEGLGPFVQTKDGGFLRSMSPSLFKNAKNNGSLIMQVSSPVVVPAEMGFGIMDILQRLASVGIEKLSMQAKKLMPLEDITGKTMQQIAWEATPALERCERQDLLQHLKPEAESAVGEISSGRSKRSKSLNITSTSGGDMSSEYVSLEDLAPLAMDKIEALSIEGLRIQSGMSDEEAPSNISPPSIGDLSALEGKGVMNSMSLGLEGTGGLKLLDVEDSGDDVDGLMGLSITLDEWMRLDSGIVDEDVISDRTSKILAAHHACSTDMISGGWKGDKRGRRSGRRWGLLGNTFTVALMVQLRDPLRNYEPVGTPMLSLIQVERVFVPPKPKIYSSVSEKGNSEEQDEEPETKTKPVAQEEKKEEEDVVPQFKIMEVHIAGLKTEPTKKKLWGNPVQQQSGSRWMLATGMGKSNKHPFMKSKAVSKSSLVTTTVQPGDTLWSISSRVHGNGAKWKELLALNPHIRNPNVIFPNETIRLQ